MKQAVMTLGGVFVALVCGCANQAEVACKEEADTPSFSGFKTLHAKDEYTHSKCIERRAHYSERLSHEEICEYSSACQDAMVGEKVEMYCDQENISQCFESKAWITANELVGLSEAVDVGVVTVTSAYKNGVTSASTCAYYNGE